jgi:hypothetical protein
MAEQKRKQFRLKLKSDGQYRNSKGTLVFRYLVSGKPDALEAYEEAQGDYFVPNDDGIPLYLTSRAVMKGSDLVVTDQGKVYVDNSALEEQASLVAQLGGNLGQALAMEIAKSMAGSKGVSDKGAPIPDDEDEGNPDKEKDKEEEKPKAGSKRRVARS